MKRSLLKALLLAASVLSRTVAPAAPIPTECGVDAVVGEAGHYSAAMLPIACVIQLRGSLQGIYGGRNPMVKLATPEMRAAALAAWRSAAHLPHRAASAITHGCRYFGCPQDAPYMRHTLHLHPVFSVGTITFYKP